MQPESSVAEQAESVEDFEALMQVLTRALRRLGEVGQPEDASRLAARAWSAIRHRHPAEADRLNGTLHYLSRLPAHTSPAAGPQQVESTAAE